MWNEPTADDLVYNYEEEMKSHKRTIEEIKEQIKDFEPSTIDYEYKFVEYIDKKKGNIQILNLVMRASEALKKLDPEYYEQELNDFMDTEYSNDPKSCDSYVELLDCLEYFESEVEKLENKIFKLSDEGPDNYEY